MSIHFNNSSSIVGAKIQFFQRIIAIFTTFFKEYVDFSNDSKLIKVKVVSKVPMVWEFFS